MLEAVGVTGRVIVDDYFITIIHEGEGGKLNKLSNRLNVGFAGEKRIPIDSIGSVQFKKVGEFGRATSGFAEKVGLGNFNKQLGGGATGFIQFSPVGGVERKSTGLTNWMPQKDENSVMFESSQQDAFERIRDFVEQKIIDRQSNRQGAAPAAAPQASRLDQLKQLAELRAAGVLSDEEFESEKRRVLSDESIK